MIYQNNFIQFSISGELVKGVVKRPVYVTLPMAEEMVQLRLACCGGQIYPLLMDVRTARGLSRQAREYLSSPPAMENLTAGAIIVGSKVEVVFAKFFMCVNKPPLPLNIFSGELEARKWLEKYKVKLEEQAA